MSKRGKVSTPVVPETTAELPSGAINTKGNKVKKNDSQKLRELKVKHNAMQEKAIELVEEVVGFEFENEELKEKLHKLELILIEQRGVIGYLEHKLEKKNDTN
jgi:hypothetical protein